MFRALFTTLAAAAAATGLMLAAPAQAAPTDTASAQDKVNELQNEGLRVIVSKFGNAPLNQCSVAAVRPGYDVSEPITGAVTGSRPRGQAVVYTTVFVDANC